ncbi:MAG: hypothetical protein LLG16_04265 [Euryarchaeota archaeon]|nr:hypothetical protein [Euryarchaeota archaeon]
MSDDVVLMVDPGACRFKGSVKASFDGEKVSIEIESDCPYVKRLNDQLENMTIEEIIKMPFGENKAYVLGGRLLKHSVCPYPMSVLKCAEHAAGFALAKDIHMEYKRD